MKKTKLLGVLAALVLVISLLPGTPVAADDDMEFFYPRETILTSFNSVWGLSPDDIYIVGNTAEHDPDNGIYHYDGTEWSTVYCPNYVMHNDVWASGPDDVWTISSNHYVWHYNGYSWYGRNLGIRKGIWGTGPDNVYAVGWNKIMHYDGTNWGQMPMDLTPEVENMWDGAKLLFTVWGSGPNDIWAGGGQGLTFLVHYDGSGWSQVTDLPSLATPMQIRDIWGSGPDDVYVVGMDYVGSNRHGVILHYDGTEWTVITSGVYEFLYGVHGTGPDDVFVCGGNEFVDEYEAIILHYNGTSWESVSSGTTDAFFSVWTDGIGNAWFCGNHSVVMKYTYGSPPWDVNQDGSINVLDMSRVGDHFGETGTPGWIREDVNSDGAVNVLDMSVIGDHFGE